MEFSKLVVFDVDGTLNQTERYAIAAYRKALEELGRGGFTDEESVFGGFEIFLWCRSKGR